jgi:hypothetical protein
VAVAERHPDAFLPAAGFTDVPGIELDCSNVVLGDRLVDGEVVGGVPLGGFGDRVTQIGTADAGTPRLKVEDYKSGKLPRKGDETVHDQLRIYVLMIEELTGICPVAARGDLHLLRGVHRRRRLRRSAGGRAGPPRGRPGGAYQADRQARDWCARPYPSRAGDPGDLPRSRRQGTPHWRHAVLGEDHGDDPAGPPHTWVVDARHEPPRTIREEPHP